MSLAQRYILVSAAFCVLLVSDAISAESNDAQLRRLKVSDKMPEFVLPDSNGDSFAYKHGTGGVSAIIFLSADQRQSEQAVSDIKKVLPEIDAGGHLLNFMIVTDEPNSQNHFALSFKDTRANFHVLLDREYKLWGQAGVIVTPTFIITARDDTLRWVKAGYGYDFAPLFKAHLLSSLGISDSNSVNEEISVQTSMNDNPQVKLQRHLHIADMLEKKGRIDSAVAEASKALQLDPNSIEAALFLGRLYCLSGDGKSAAKTVGMVKARTRIEEAELNLILGWAYHQTGDVDAAIKALIEATTLDRKSSRGFYELGKIYQGRHDNEKAIEAYRKALDILFSENP